MKDKGYRINDQGEAEFDSDLRAIPDYAFSGEDDLRVCHIPDHIQVIGYRAFENCKNLEKLTFAEGLNMIEMEAFINCGSLKAVVLPDTVEDIGGNVFYGTGIEAPVYNTSRTTLFHYPNHLEDTYFEVPPTVREITSTAFGPNKHLKDLRLSNGVRELHPNTFWDSYLTRVVIPPTVRRLRHAFYNCPDLQEVILEGETELDDAFEKCPNAEVTRCAITASPHLYDLWNPFSDVRQIRLPADTGYTETEAFRKLSQRLTDGDILAMHELSLYFWEVHFARPHCFFLWAAQFWSCQYAQRRSERREVMDVFPEAAEYEHGKRVIDGELLHCLGLLWFSKDRLYRFHSTDNPDIVLVSTPCLSGALLQVYDNDDLDSKDRFDWTYCDSRYLTPLSDTLCRYSFYEPMESSSGRFLEAGSKALRALKNREGNEAC